MASAPNDSPIIEEAGLTSRVAQTGLLAETIEQVHVPSSSPLSNSGQPNASTLIGESKRPIEVDDVEPNRSDQPKTFWQLSASELVAYTLTKNSALRADIKGDAFVNLDLSTQNLLSMLTVENKNQLVAEIGFDPSTKLFKSIMFESFLVKEILADNHVPQIYRNYWNAFQTSKHSVGSFAGTQSTPSQVAESTAKRLDFGNAGSPAPLFMNLPGRQDQIQTPAFYKHIVGATNSLFHLLKPADNSMHSSASIASFGGNGQISISLNMQPQAAIIHKFPQLDAFNKLTVSPFLLAYKTAKLGAPAGTKKTLKECINPLVWSDVARACGVSLETFETKTDDQTIYASMLGKYGPTTADEAIVLLKNIVFEFDDSITPQEFFAGELSKHFVKVREQLAQFLYWKFEEGKELSAEACIMCLQDNFHHNPLIKGKDGTMVKKSSNNATILEKIQLNRHSPITEIMQKLIDGFEADDKLSLRRGYKVTPWRTEGDNKSIPNHHTKQGGIQKKPRDFKPRVKPCSKCGRQHKPTLDECLLFDHTNANKDPEWSVDQKPLQVADWTEWISKKEKTHPDLVKESKI
jgi:hypothetical protein